MSLPGIDRPDLPEFMTWEQLAELPEEIAEQIELWEGRVVWLRRGPGEHQIFTRRLTNALERSARDDMAAHPDRCWVANLETNVFLGATGKSDFVTPDFLVHRCLDGPYRDVRAADTVMVGEVLSPSNTSALMQAKRARYAAAGIPWYWEVILEPDTSAIAVIQAYGLDTAPARLPHGVSPLHPVDYRLVDEWINDDGAVVAFPQPFAIEIPWSALSF
ncbi:Uma2 family endonuclease [Nocardia asteroides]|uniref:Uma2 family endonuclease n=1 Tax=Nocardia asteroides TaxID=1824 RepID=UPI001E4DA5A9|nr:Uma2 family endonuclease [Nocardia asteroides]UGT57083.1 Uma2 family endonuclease [Nocardia asteroides]